MAPARCTTRHRRRRPRSPMARLALCSMCCAISATNSEPTLAGERAEPLAAARTCGEPIRRPTAAIRWPWNLEPQRALAGLQQGLGQLPAARNRAPAPESSGPGEPMIQPQPVFRARAGTGRRSPRSWALLAIGGGLHADREDRGTGQADRDQPNAHPAGCARKPDRDSTLPSAITWSCSGLAAKGAQTCRSPVHEPRPPPPVAARHRLSACCWPPAAPPVLAEPLADALRLAGRRAARLDWRGHAGCRARWSSVSTPSAWPVTAIAEAQTAARCRGVAGWAG